MAAGEDTSSIESAREGRRPLDALEWPGAAALDARLLEEIGRAERHGTQLSCLLVVVEDLEEMAGEGQRAEAVAERTPSPSEIAVEDLRQQTMAYIASALSREIRRFDRVGMPSERELL